MSNYKNSDSSSQLLAFLVIMLALASINVVRPNLKYQVMDAIAVDGPTTPTMLSEIAQESVLDQELSPMELALCAKSKISLRPFVFPAARANMGLSIDFSYLGAEVTSNSDWLKAKLDSTPDGGQQISVTIEPNTTPFPRRAIFYEDGMKRSVLQCGATENKESAN